jgi:lysophospholipase L1-like esterase
MVATWKDLTKRRESLFPAFNNSYENRVKSITTETKTDLTLYPQWVKKTRSNTYVSFLGDSITTYQDTIPQEFPTYYPAGDVNSVDKTWWKITLELSGTNLLANNSYSGSFVSQGSMYGASTKRLELLSKNGMDPDAVVVYMGTNDLTHGITLSKFTTMYKEMIENIKKMYDDVDIFVLTMPSNKYAISFNEPREKMNKAITDIATEYGLFLIDLVELINFDNAYDCMYAGAHPNALGMEIIGKEVSKHISREYKRYWLGEE